MDELNQIKADFKSYNAVVEELATSITEGRVTVGEIYEIVSDLLGME